MKQYLLLLQNHLLVMTGLAFGNLMRRAALLHGFGSFRRDVDGADGLAVRVEGGAGVLALVPGANGLDQQ